MLTGVWKLDHSKSTSSKEFLEMLDRPSWQVKVADYTTETLRILNYVKHGKQLVVKNVKIRLKSRVLAALFFAVPFTKLDYSHRLRADGEHQHHENDEKQFGNCTSITTAQNDGFTIRWCLSTSEILAVHKLITKNQLHVELTITKDGKSVTICKVYNRSNFQPADKIEIPQLPHFKWLQGYI